MTKAVALLDIESKKEAAKEEEKEEKKPKTLYYRKDYGDMNQ